MRPDQRAMYNVRAPHTRSVIGRESSLNLHTVTHSAVRTVYAACVHDQRTCIRSAIGRDPSSDLCTATHSVVRTVYAACVHDQRTCIHSVIGRDPSFNLCTQSHTVRCAQCTQHAYMTSTRAYTVLLAGTLLVQSCKDGYRQKCKTIGHAFYV